MPQSLSRNVVHLVFSTKNRNPFITPELKPRLHAYLAGILNREKCQAIEVGGVEDHVHLLFLQHRTECMSDIVEAKTSSSKWAKNEGVSQFAWQHGYASLSIGRSEEDNVVRYIQGQEEHHRKRSFQEEYRALLDEHGVPYDERYMWD